MREVNRGNYANSPIRYDLLPKSAVKISSESEIRAKLLLLHTQSKIWAQKWMNLQSAAIAGCRNPLKPCFESEIRAKIFSKSADPFAYSPASYMQLCSLRCLGLEFELHGLKLHQTFTSAN